MSRKRPITIKRGTFVCTLYDVGNLMELPLANLRKLWKLMFSEAWENRETIQMIRDWLPVNIKDAEQSARALQDTLQQSTQELEQRRREVEMFGSVVTKEQKAAHAAARREHKAAERADRAAKAARVKAEKLQTIFNEMSKN
jgi:hypothetical protein